MGIYAAERLKPVSVTADYTALIDDDVIFASGTVTITLPTIASAVTARTIYIKNTGSNNVTVDGNGSETIDGETTQTVYPDACMTIVPATASDWSII